MYLIPYSYNIPVLGKTQSAIYNLQEGKINIVPNSMFYFFKDTQKLSLDQLKKKYGNISEYVKYLIDNEICFQKNHNKGFSELNLSLSTPYLLRTAIIEYNFENFYDIENLLRQIIKLRCSFIELRIKNTSSIKNIKRILSVLKNTCIISIDLFILYDFKINENQLIEMYSKYSKINRIIVHGASNKNTKDGIYYFKENFYPSIFKRKFPKNKLIINQDFFSESQNYNPYFNKKVSIDEYGNIKNCLLLKNNFGNINNTTLDQVLINSSFQRLWNINVDKIVNYKDSELRYGLYVGYDLKKIDNDLYEIID